MFLFSTKSRFKDFFFWRNNMFLFSTKSSLKELFFFIRPLMFFMHAFPLMFVAYKLLEAIIAIIKACCTCVGQSLQSSKLVALALGNHC
eukprot:UN21640